jgi:hypothetical protein
MERPSPIGEPETGDARSARCRGRPRGTNYRSVDAPLHAKMRQMPANGLAPSRTAAAKQVLDKTRAFGSGTFEVKSCALGAHIPRVISAPFFSVFLHSNCTTRTRGGRM